MIYKFSEILTIKNGKNQKKIENPLGKYPIYGSGGIIGYGNDYICEKDTVIVGRKGNINKPLYIEEPFWNVDTAFGLVADINILFPKYLYYFCVKYNFEKLNTTVTIPSLTKSNLLEIKIDLPNLFKQKEISKQLDKVLKILELKKQQLSELDRLVKFQFLEMFGDPILNEKNWKTEKLENIYKIIDGDRGKNYPKQNEFYKDEFCLFLNAKNVTNFGFNFDKVEFITKEKDEMLRSGKLERGDIVVTTRGTIGNTAYYDNNIIFENIRINSGMVILREKEKINPIFFIKYFQNFKIYNKVVSGTAQPQIPITNMKNLKIIAPPIELQNKFADFVKQVDKSKVILGKALKFLSFRLNYFNML